MIAANDNRRNDFALPHELVHRNPKLRARAVTEPANARGQTLKLNPLPGEFHPTRERLVFREQLDRQAIGPRNVGGIATERDPTERSLPFAEERPDIFWHEPGNIERLL